MSESQKKKIVHVHLPANEPFKTTITAGRHELIADEPPHVEGGKDKGPDPYDLLLMSLGTCTAMTMKMYALRKSWPVEDIYIEMRHNKRHADDCVDCESSSSKMDLIEKEIIIKGNLNTEQLKKLIVISKKCPVHRTLMSEISINTMLAK